MQRTIPGKVVRLRIGRVYRDAELQRKLIELSFGESGYMQPFLYSALLDYSKNTFDYETCRRENKVGRWFIWAFYDQKDFIRGWVLMRTPGEYSKRDKHPVIMTYVNPAWRSGGIGRRLVAAAKRKLKMRGLNTLGVYPYCEEARGFYCSTLRKAVPQRNRDTATVINL